MCQIVTVSLHIPSCQVETLQFVWCFDISGSDCTKGQAAKMVSDAHEEGANYRHAWHLQGADAACSVTAMKCNRKDPQQNGNGTPKRNTLGTSISIIVCNVFVYLVNGVVWMMDSFV